MGWTRPEHPSAYHYKQGCKCEPCHQAFLERQRKYDRKHYAKTYVPTRLLRKDWEKLPPEQELALLIKEQAKDMKWGHKMLPVHGVVMSLDVKLPGVDNGMSYADLVYKDEDGDTQMYFPSRVYTG